MHRRTRNLIAAATAALSALAPVCLGQAYDLEILLRTGDTFGGHTLQAIGGLSINDSGSVAVAGGSDNSISMVIVDGVLIAEEGGVYGVDAPDGTATGTGMVLDDFNWNSVKINNPGDVAVVTFASELVRFNAGAGDVNLLAEQGITLPGGPHTSLSSVTLASITSAVQLRDDGSAFFHGRYESPDGEKDGVFSNSEVIVGAPDSIGGYPIEDLDSSPSALAVDDNGTLYFMPRPRNGGRALLTPTSVLYEDGGLFGSEQIRRLSDSAEIVVNASGLLAFKVRFDSIIEPLRIVTSDGRIIASEGDSIDGVTVSLIDDLAINDRGEFAFTTTEGQVFGPLGVVAEAGTLIEDIVLQFLRADQFELGQDGTIYFNAEATSPLGYSGVVTVKATPRSTPCIADLTTSGATLPGQSGYDEPDGKVDLDDLGFYLNDWLASAPAADFTTTGATLEGQPGFGDPDSVVDLDDLGYFLGFWLAGCP
ncbi:MAG: GC-type dockerin domain-anchored protein [Planctomycetota bacterium]